MKKIIILILFVFIVLGGYGQLLKKMESIKFKALPPLPTYYNCMPLSKIPTVQTYFVITKRVIILPLDNMPCLVPCTENVANMPVASYNNLSVENIPNFFRKNNSIEDMKNK